MAYTLWSNNSAYSSTTQTLKVVDQISTGPITFTVEDRTEINPIPANIVSVGINGTAPAGLNITLVKNVSNFTIKVDITPSIPLGNLDFTDLIEINYYDPIAEGNDTTYLSIHVTPLIRKIYYYSNDLSGTTKLVACKLAPEFVSFKNGWISGTTYNPDDTVTYGGYTWFCLQGTASVSTTPPSEGAYWTRFPYDGSGVAPNFIPNFHVKAAALSNPNNTTKIVSIWAKVFFSVDITGKVTNPVFFANGNIPSSPTPTGKLVLVPGTTTVYETKNNLGGFYEASLTDSSSGSSFYLSFSYDQLNQSFRPSGPALPIIKDLTSTFTSNGSAVSSPVTLRAGITEPAYKLEVNVNGHILNLPAGTNYANLVYRRDADFGAGGFNDFTAITTNNTAPVYISSTVTNTFANPVGKTSYQLRFNEPGSYYIIGRPTGDLNQTSSTLGSGTNALRIIVEPAISTAFKWGPFTPPITGNIEVPIDMSAVTPGNLRWTLHPFNGVAPTVYLCSKNTTTGVITKYFASGTNTTIDQPVDFVYPTANTSYLLLIEANTPTTQTYTGILTLKNRDYTTSSDTTANFTFSRPSASFIVNATPPATQFGGTTITGSYAGLPSAVTGIIPSGGSGTLTFGTATFSGGTTGTFTIPITYASTANPDGYTVTVKAQNGGVDIPGASGQTLVKVNAATGQPSLNVYSPGTDYPILCQVQASDSDAKVCGSWHPNVLKKDPTNSDTKNLVEKAYFTLSDINGVQVKAGLYTISASLDGNTWTPVLTPGINDSVVDSNNYQFVTIGRVNNTSYPIYVNIRSGVAVSSPYLYIRVAISTYQSVAYKITCIPNIQIYAGTNTASITAHTPKIENNAGAFFTVNTALDGWSTDTCTRFETNNALYVSFPNVVPFTKDETWVLQRNGAKSGSAAKYNLFFETNAYTGANYFFINFKYPSGSSLPFISIFKIDLNVAAKGNLNLRTAAGTTVATASIGDVVTFNAANVDASRLYTYSQNASDATAWVITTPASTSRSYTVTATDGVVFITASYGDIIGAIKYNIVGQGCSLVATSTFLSSFVLPTASENNYYPAGAPSTAGGVKLPTKVEVVTSSGGTPTYKTVKSDGTGWQFLSASYDGTVLEILPLSQTMRYNSTSPTAFNFQIAQNTPTTTDYRLKLSNALNVGGLPISGSSTLTIVFKANFSTNECATISRSIPVRQYSYTTDPPVTSNACDYFPPSSGGSQQYSCPTGYSNLEEVLADNISISTTEFTTKYGLSVFSDKLTTLALTTPLKAASLNESYYGFTDLNYNVYVVVGNGTASKRIIPLAYYKQYTPPNYLPYPQKIGLTTTPSGTSLVCYNGDKVYISLLSTISTAFNYTNYELVFITGTTTIAQAISGYDVPTKTLSFTVTSGVFVSNTPYTIGIRHKTTDCIYFGTPGLTFTSGGTRPSGPIEITQPAEQEPCVPSITVNAKSPSGTDVSSITRVQVYKTSAGTVGTNYVGDVAVWDNITPSIGSTGKELSFLLNNSTKQFASTQTDKKIQDYFVSFYTGSAAGGYVPFAQGVPLALILKNPALNGSETNLNRKPAYTTPVGTLYENTLTVTCTSCKDGSCGTTNLALLSTITWSDSLSAPLPDWLTLTPDPVNFNKALISGTPLNTNSDTFTVVATVPYYVDGNGAPYTHTYEFDITLTPTTVFSIGDNTVFPNATHYQNTYTNTITVTNRPSVDCASLTWTITDRELAGADKALPLSTPASPITFTNGVFTWEDVDDLDATYPVKYVFGIKATCTGGSTATGSVTLIVDPRNPVVGGITPVYGYFDITNETVTITGYDFYPSPNGTVRFGNEQATNILVNVTHDAITCTPPTKADIGGEDLPVEVKVYNSDGGVSKLGIFYTYQRKRNPIITDIVPAGGTFRGGTKVAIIGANFEPTSTVIIDDVLQPILSVTPTSIIFVTMPHSVGPATVKVTNSVPPISSTTYSFAAEPRVSDVQPYNISADGGIDVYIIGTDFQSGVRVFLDDYEIPADRITVL